jgi:hypothetical protein
MGRLMNFSKTYNHKLVVVIWFWVLSSLPLELRAQFLDFGCFGGVLSFLPVWVFRCVRRSSPRTSSHCLAREHLVCIFAVLRAWVWFWNSGQIFQKKFKTPIHPIWSPFLVLRSLHDVTHPRRKALKPACFLFGLSSSAYAHVASKGRGIPGLCCFAWASVPICCSLAYLSPSLLVLELEIQEPLF